MHVDSVTVVIEKKLDESQYLVFDSMYLVFAR